MAVRFNHLAVVVTAVVATLAWSPFARADTAPSSIDEVYRQIKDAERSIPVPTPRATVNIGTFNAATGAFDGLATEVEIINGKPVRLVPELRINAVNLSLVISISNATQPVRASVTGGGSAFVLAGRTSITVDAGRLRTVKWSVSSGTKIHRDELTVKRPSIIGGGAFTIPALPVAVAYDPPQNAARTNSVVYTRTTSIGTTLGLTLRSATGASSSADPPKFSEPAIFHQQLQAAAGFASVTGNSAAATALKTIDGLLGGAKRNVATMSDGTSTTRRTYTFTESHTCAVDAGTAHLGPGHTDVVWYLRNVRLVWVDNGSSTFLDLIGYDTIECPTIDQLRSGLAGLDGATAAPLTALDPFAGALGAKTPLGADPRFVGLPGIGLLPGIVHTATYQQQLQVETAGVETSTRVVTDDLSAGLLSFIGLAPTESKQVVSTVSLSSIAGSSEATTVLTSLEARTLAEGVRTELGVFYDRLFGNIAFVDPRP